MPCFDLAKEMRLANIARIREKLGKQGSYPHAEHARAIDGHRAKPRRDPPLSRAILSQVSARIRFRAANGKLANRFGWMV